MQHLPEYDHNLTLCHLFWGFRLESKALAYVDSRYPLPQMPGHSCRNTGHQQRPGQIMKCRRLLAASILSLNDLTWLWERRSGRTRLPIMSQTFTNKPARTLPGILGGGRWNCRRLAAARQDRAGFVPIKDLGASSCCGTLVLSQLMTIKPHLRFAQSVDVVTTDLKIFQLETVRVGLSACLVTKLPSTAGQKSNFERY